MLPGGSFCLGALLVGVVAVCFAVRVPSLQPFGCGQLGTHWCEDGSAGALHYVVLYDMIVSFDVVIFYVVVDVYVLSA